MMPTIRLPNALIVALPGMLMNREKLGLIRVMAPIAMGIIPMMMRSRLVVSSIMWP